MLITEAGLQTLIFGIVNLLVLISILLFVLIHLGKATYDKHNRREHSFLFPYYVRQWGLAASRPVKRLIIRAGLKPDTLSIAGMVFLLLAGIAFGFRLFGAGAWGITFGGLMDVLDGMIARETSQATKRGAFLDSSIDRYGEGFVFLGLFIGLWNWGLLTEVAVLLGLMGSLLVSYTKARGEALGVSCTGGIMQRPERLLIMALGTGITPVLDLFGIKGIYSTLGAVWIVALLSNVTVIQRIILIARKLKAVDDNENI